MDILRKQLSDKEAEYKEGKTVLKRSNKTLYNYIQDMLEYQQTFVQGLIAQKQVSLTPG